jgi:putative endonuclease
VIYYIYILQSEVDSSYYIGQTNNLDDRLRRHNEGRSNYTRSKKPWKLVYTEKFDSRKEAVRRETEIKSKKSRAFIEQLIAMNDLKKNAGG